MNVRIIARLDIKGPNLIKGINLEGLRVVGNPQEFARKYYADGVDELIYLDAVASLYNRNNLRDIVRYTTREVFIPLTVGGGIRSVEDAREILRSGADKIAINTAAVKNPGLIREISLRFGSQCMVLSIQAKKKGDSWEVYTDSGREHTGLDVVEWAVQAQQLGAGEVFLTSVDRDGTGRGFDLDLIKAVNSKVSIPVIASGGLGSCEHFVEVVKKANAGAVAVAKSLHYNQITLDEVRQAAVANGIPVRLDI